MVGGLGARLKPLTENIPKPMLNVGGQPILKTIVKGFVDNGFTNITMCLGYMSNVIQDYFKDGNDFGANIKYIVEERRLGTAGALSLIKEKIDKHYKNKTDIMYAASQLWIDAVIDPAETRSWISMGIDMANHAPITEKFNMGILQV